MVAGLEGGKEWNRQQNTTVPPRTTNTTDRGGWGGLSFDSHYEQKASDKQQKYSGFAPLFPTFCLFAFFSCLLLLFLLFIFNPFCSSPPQQTPPNPCLSTSGCLA